MLTIKAPYIQADDKYATLYCDILEDGILKTVWFQVDVKYKDYLVYERVDAYVIALLNYAMRNGHDIQSDFPITGRLFYQLNTYLIDALSSTSSGLYRTQLCIPIANEVLACANAVGTGISCGIDSFHALASNTTTNNKSLDISHLCFNNVGSHGEGERARLLFEGRRKLAKNFCTEYGFEYVESDSNLMDAFAQNHYLSHTYSSCFPVFCLRKLFGVYYYASGTSYYNFSLKNNEFYPPCKYELLSLPNFSLSNLVIYSEGALKTRNEKLKSILDFKPSHKYLNVCTEAIDNCSKCEKCVRTLIGLDSLGSLHKYSKVFDIECYKANRDWFLSQLYLYYSIGKSDYVDPYNILKSQISLLSKIKVYPLIIRSKISEKYSGHLLYKYFKGLYAKLK